MCAWWDVEACVVVCITSVNRWGRHLCVRCVCAHVCDCGQFTKWDASKVVPESVCALAGVEEDTKHKQIWVSGAAGLCVFALRVKVTHTNKHTLRQLPVSVWTHVLHICMHACKHSFTLRGLGEGYAAGVGQTHRATSHLALWRTPPLLTSAENRTRKWIFQDLISTHTRGRPQLEQHLCLCHCLLLVLYYPPCIDHSHWPAVIHLCCFPLRKQSLFRRLSANIWTVEM